ncbi:M20 family metallopeptidase [Geminicoccaceae bacterium 1502E]|nr:M20 family metallopeptidase [Geminicoccaceae bacterium 1502E]
MFDANAILEEIREWVELETPTSAPEAVTGMMERVAAQFRGIGLETRIVPARDGMGANLLVETPWGKDEPGILVLSHLDTVHPVGTLASTLPFRVEGDKAFGPGIYDMKGGAFLAFAAMRAILAEGGRPKLPVRWVIASDEEVGSPTSRALIEAAGDRAKHVLVTEPARFGGKCVTARKGSARYVVRFHGRPAHSGGNHADGRSAIKEMARQILALEALTDYERGVTVNVGIVSGGTALNVIPEHATAEVDVRLPDPASVEEVLPRITGLKPFDEDVAITVEGQLNRPPYVKTPAITALLEKAQKLAAEIGFELVDTASGGGSDGNFLAGRLPVLDGLGVDGAGAHTQEEHILISSIVPRATLMKRLLETLD